MKNAVLWAAMVLVIGSTLSLATPINGQFFITGGTVRVVGATDIDYGPPGPPSPGTAGGFSAVGATGDLVGIIGDPEAGEILDLNAIAQPVGAPFSYPNFISFPGVPGFTLEAQFIFPGTNPVGDCSLAGSTCTPSLGEPPFSPFNLDNVAGGSTVSFVIRGQAFNNNDGDTTPDANWTGIFTAQFTPESYQDIIGLLGSQGFVQTSYSATVTLSSTVIPEPATFGLLGMGLFGLGVARFVRRKRNRR